MAQGSPDRHVALLLLLSVVLAGCLADVTAVADHLDRSSATDPTTMTDAATETATPCRETTSSNAAVISPAPRGDNLSAANATALAEQYESTYRDAQSELADREGIGTFAQPTNVTQVEGGYLVELDVVFGGEFVRTAEPDRLTSVIEDGEVTLHTTRSPETTVVNVDDFYTAYYFISATRVVRHETTRDGAPPALPRHSGELLLCRTTGR